MDYVAILQSLVLFATAAVGGAINAVAGGGTLLTFPSLLWAGQLEIVANATSTVALWPGAASSFWGYRQELGRHGRYMFALAAPSLLGGIVGAVLLVRTDNATFAALVPYLFLVATLLFAVQEPLSRWLRPVESRVDGGTGATAGLSSSTRVGKPPVASFKSGADETVLPSSPLRWALVLVFQFGIGVYGGYFGAGIGILMLAAFGYLGFTNIHQTNALKNLNAMCINGVAAAIFIARGLVDWRLVALMAAGAIVGGYAGAGTARWVGQRNVRRIVVLVGVLLTLSLLR